MVIIQFDHQGEGRHRPCWGPLHCGLCTPLDHEDLNDAVYHKHSDMSIFANLTLLQPWPCTKAPSATAPPTRERCQLWPRPTASSTSDPRISWRGRTCQAMQCNVIECGLWYQLQLWFFVAMGNGRWSSLLEKLFLLQDLLTLQGFDIADFILPKESDHNTMHYSEVNKLAGPHNAGFRSSVFLTCKFGALHCASGSFQLCEKVLMRSQYRLWAIGYGFWLCINNQYDMIKC